MLKSRITKNIEESPSVAVFSYSQLASACYLHEPTIVVSDHMDLNRCEQIRSETQDGLIEDEEIL